MLPVLQIGPLAVQTPGLALLLGIWLGLSLAEKHAARQGISASKLYNLVFVTLIAGLVGARLVYALRYPSAFAASPLSLLSLNPGLLDAWGGTAAGLIVGLAFGQRSHMPLWPLLDALTPGLAVFMISLAAANFASGAGFGAPTQLPWGINLWGETRHPSQIYELLAAGLILAIVWPGEERIRTTPVGAYFLGFTALSCTSRLFLEGFRGDSLLLPGGLRAAQVVAWLGLAACLWGLYRRTAAEREPATEFTVITEKKF
jgi:phosphatidylglycerol:prolipoprotein diacylglycerol transferase